MCKHTALMAKALNVDENEIYCILCDESQKEEVVNMKFQVGDSVRIKADLNLHTRYYTGDGEDFDWAVQSMVALAGRIVTITKVNPSYNFYYIENYDECWTDEMFEDRVYSTAVCKECKGELDNCPDCWEGKATDTVTAYSKELVFNEQFYQEAVKKQDIITTVCTIEELGDVDIDPQDAAYRLVGDERFTKGVVKDILESYYLGTHSYYNTCYYVYNSMKLRGLPLAGIVDTNHNL